MNDFVKFRTIASGMGALEDDNFCFMGCKLVNHRYRKTDFSMMTALSDMLDEPVTMGTSSPENVTSSVISPCGRKHSDVTMSSAEADTRRSKKRNVDADRRREQLSNGRAVPLETGIFNIAYASKEVRVRRTDVFTIEKEKLEKIRQDLSTPSSLESLPKRHKSVDSKRNTTLPPLEIRGQRSRSLYPGKRQALTHEKDAKANKSEKSRGPTSTRRNKSVTDRRSKTDRSTGHRTNSCNAKDRKDVKPVPSNVTPKTRHTADVIAELDVSNMDIDNSGKSSPMSSLPKRHQSVGARRNGNLPPLETRGQRSMSMYPIKRKEASKKTDDKVEKSHGPSAARRNKSVTDRRSIADRTTANRAKSCATKDREALKAMANTGAPKKTSMGGVLAELDASTVDIGNTGSCPSTIHRNRSLTDRRSKNNRSRAHRPKSCSAKDRKALGADSPRSSTNKTSMVDVMAEIDLLDILDMKEQGSPVEPTRRARSLERKSSQTNNGSHGHRSKSLVANVRKLIAPDAAFDWLPPKFAALVSDAQKKKKKTVHFDLDAPGARIRIKPRKPTVKHTKKSLERQERNELRAAAVALLADATDTANFDTTLGERSTKSGDHRITAMAKISADKKHFETKGFNDHMTPEERAKLAKMKRDLCMPNKRPERRYAAPTTRPLDLSRVNRNSNFSWLPVKFLAPLKRREEKNTASATVDDPDAKSKQNKLKVRHTKKSREQKEKLKEKASADVSNEAVIRKKSNKKKRAHATVTNNAGKAETTGAPDDRHDRQTRQMIVKKPSLNNDKETHQRNTALSDVSRVGPSQKPRPKANPEVDEEIIKANATTSGVSGIEVSRSRSPGSSVSPDKGSKLDRSSVTTRSDCTRRSTLSNRSPPPTPSSRVAYSAQQIRKRPRTAKNDADEYSSRAITPVSSVSEKAVSVEEDTHRSCEAAEMDSATSGNNSRCRSSDDGNNCKRPPDLDHMSALSTSATPSALSRKSVDGQQICVEESQRAEQGSVARMKNCTSRSRSKSLSSDRSRSRSPDESPKSTRSGTGTLSARPKHSRRSYRSPSPTPRSRAPMPSHWTPRWSPVHDGSDSTRIVTSKNRSSGRPRSNRNRDSSSPYSRLGSISPTASDSALSVMSDKTSNHEGSDRKQTLSGHKSPEAESKMLCSTPRRGSSTRPLSSVSSPCSGRGCSSRSVKAIVKRSPSEVGLMTPASSEANTQHSTSGLSNKKGYGVQSAESSRLYQGQDTNENNPSLTTRSPRSRPSSVSSFRARPSSSSGHPGAASPGSVRSDSRSRSIASCRSASEKRHQSVDPVCTSPISMQNSAKKEGKAESRPTSMRSTSTSHERVADMTSLSDTARSASSTRSAKSRSSTASGSNRSMSAVKSSSQPGNLSVEKTIPVKSTVSSISLRSNASNAGVTNRTTEKSPSKSTNTVDMSAPTPPSARSVVSASSVRSRSQTVINDSRKSASSDRSSDTHITPARSFTRAFSVSSNDSSIKEYDRPLTADSSRISVTSGRVSTKASTSARSLTSVRSARSRASANSDSKKLVGSIAKPPISPRNISRTSTPCSARSVSSITSQHGEKSIASTESSGSKSPMTHGAAANGANNIRHGTTSRPVMSSRHMSSSVPNSARSANSQTSVQNIESAASPRSTKSKTSVSSGASFKAPASARSVSSSTSNVSTVDTLPTFGDNNIASSKTFTRPTTAAFPRKRIGTAKPAPARRLAM